MKSYIAGTVKKSYINYLFQNWSKGTFGSALIIIVSAADFRKSNYKALLQPRDSSNEYISSVSASPWYLDIHSLQIEIFEWHNANPLYIDIIIQMKIVGLSLLQIWGKSSASINLLSLIPHLQQAQFSNFWGSFLCTNLVILSISHSGWAVPTPKV